MAEVDDWMEIAEVMMEFYEQFFSMGPDVKNIIMILK